MSKKTKNNVESLVVSKNSTGAVMKHLNYSIEDVLKNSEEKDIKNLLKRIKELQKAKQELNIGEIEKMAFKLAKGFYYTEVTEEERFHPKTFEIVLLTKKIRKFIKPDITAIKMLLNAYLPEIYGEYDSDNDFNLVDIDFSLITKPKIVEVNKIEDKS